MSDRGTAYELAEMAAGITREVIPSSAVEATKRMVLHIFGMSLLGTELPQARQAVAFSRAEPGSATVIGGSTASAAAAAFANATVSHVDFREDSHDRSSSHPGVGVIPAALAVGEAHAPSEPDPDAFVEAVVRGYEVTSRLGAAGSQEATERGFRPSSLYPGFGAAVAAARMMRLSVEQTAHALSLTTQASCGTTQSFYDGAEDWYFAPGFGARAGITAALLAAQGAEGAPHNIEGEHGFLRAFTGRADWTIDTSPTTAYAVEEARLKRVLTCGWNQTLVHLLGEVPGGVSADDLASARVVLSRQAAEFPGVDSTGPYATKTAALLSSPYALALKVCRGSLTHAGYDRLDDPQLLAVASRVSVEVDPGYRGYSTALEVVKADGTTEFLSYGGDEHDHGLHTVDAVTANLEAAFGDGGLDPARARTVERATQAAVDGGDLRPLGQVLSG